HEPASPSPGLLLRTAAILLSWPLLRFPLLLSLLRPFLPFQFWATLPRALVILNAATGPAPHPGPLPSGWGVSEYRRVGVSELRHADTPTLRHSTWAGMRGP